MMNLTCPVITGPFLEAKPCGADAVGLEVSPSTGEFTAYCGEHVSLAGGPGLVVVTVTAPLHSTSLFTR